MFTKHADAIGVTPLRDAARGWWVALVVLSVSGAAWAATPVPEKLAAADRQVIEATIRQQLDAFTKDDADRAYGFATPEIQRQFGDAERFLQTVRDHYEAVYRPGSVFFSRLAIVDGEWVQTVQLSDQEGRVWRALFIMRRQPDRSWKIGGCQLLETSALST